MPSQFQIISSLDGLHVFALVNDDERQLVQSVLHRSRDRLVEAIELVRRAALQDQAAQTWRSLDGQHYFQLRDPHGQLLANSNLYSSIEALKADLDEVARLAAEAGVVEIGSRSAHAADPASQGQSAAGKRLDKRN